MEGKRLSGAREETADTTMDMEGLLEGTAVFTEDVVQKKSRALIEPRDGAQESSSSMESCIKP